MLSINIQSYKTVERNNYKVTCITHQLDVATRVLRRVGESLINMPGAHGSQIVMRDCAEGDAVRRTQSGVLGTVTCVQTVSDGPHGMCASSEVTVQWEGASEAVRLNGMAPRSSECSPSGVLWWKTEKTTSKATVTPNDSAFVAQLTHYFTNVVEAPKSEARILQLATKYATNKVKLYAALKKKFGQPVPTPGSTLSVKATQEKTAKPPLPPQAAAAAAAADEQVQLQLQLERAADARDAADRAAAKQRKQERQESAKLRREKKREEDNERARVERERVREEREHAIREKAQGRAGTPGFGMLSKNKVERDRILAQSKKWLQDRVGENCRNCRTHTMFVIAQGGTGGACGASISVTNNYQHKCPNCFATSTSSVTYNDDDF